MKRITLIAIVILIVVAGWFIWKHPYDSSKQFTPVKHCMNINNPCYEITMPGQPDLFINSWKHYGDTNCVDFTSLPDGNFHGYCGVYKIEKLHY